MYNISVYESRKKEENKKLLEKRLFNKLEEKRKSIHKIIQRTYLNLLKNMIKESKTLYMR